MMDTPARTLRLLLVALQKETRRNQDDVPSIARQP
jgi:hypothetical protein